MSQAGSSTGQPKPLQVDRTYFVVGRWLFLQVTPAGYSLWEAVIQHNTSALP